jgi:hypothetical protein
MKLEAAARFAALVSMTLAVERLFSGDAVKALPLALLAVALLRLASTRAIPPAG